MPTIDLVPPEVQSTETVADASHACAGPAPSDERLRAIIADASAPAEVRRMAQELVDARTALGFHRIADEAERGPGYCYLGEADMRADHEAIDPHGKAGAR